MLSLIFWHQYHVKWYFLVIFNTKIIKSTKIIITIITHIIVVIIVTWFCNTRKNLVFDVQKKWYKLPELGGGGGREFGQCPKEIDFSYVRSSLMEVIELADKQVHKVGEEVTRVVTKEVRGMVC